MNSHETSALRRASELAVRRARAAWPSIVVDAAEFHVFVADKSALDPAFDAAALDRYGVDLVLAFVCAAGDPNALATFERLYFSDEVDAPTRRARLRGADEMRQRVRSKLFVGPAPKIGSYAGRSSLRVWLRAVVSRLLIDASRERSRDVPTPHDDFVELAASGDAPDRRLLKQTYERAFRQAFDLAAERLSTRDKNLLRYGLAEGLNIDQIGRIYGVHRVTAARWLQKARAVFVDHVRALVMERQRLTASEFDSVLRVMLSQIDLTIGRVLRVTT